MNSCIGVVPQQPKARAARRTNAFVWYIFRVLITVTAARLAGQGPRPFWVGRTIAQPTADATCRAARASKFRAQPEATDRDGLAVLAAVALRGGVRAQREVASNVAMTRPQIGAQHQHVAARSPPPSRRTDRAISAVTRP